MYLGRVCSDNLRQVGGNIVEINSRETPGRICGENLDGDPFAGIRVELLNDSSRITQGVPWKFIQQFHGNFSSSSPRIPTGASQKFRYDLPQEILGIFSRSSLEIRPGVPWKFLQKFTGNSSMSSPKIAAGVTRNFLKNFLKNFLQQFFGNLSENSPKISPEVSQEFLRNSFRCSLGISPGVTRRFLQECLGNLFSSSSRIPPEVPENYSLPARVSRKFLEDFLQEIHGNFSRSSLEFLPRVPRKFLQKLLVNSSKSSPGIPSWVPRK